MDCNHLCVFLKLDLKRIRVHDLRHTSATLKIIKGDNVADVPVGTSIVLEMKIVICMVSQINRDDADFQIYKIWIKDFMGLKERTTNMYYEAKFITKSLLEKMFEIKEDDGLLQVDHMSHNKYYAGQGYICQCKA